MGADGAQFLVGERAEFINVFVRDDKDISIVAGDLEHAIVEKTGLELQGIRYMLWLFSLFPANCVPYCSPQLCVQVRRWKNGTQPET